MIKKPKIKEKTEMIITRQIPEAITRQMLKIPNKHEIIFIMYDPIKKELEIKTKIK